MKRGISFFHPKLPVYLVYMLQQVEYEPKAFLAWLKRIPQLNHIMHRQQLVWTSKAKLLVYFTYGIAALGVAKILLLLFLTDSYWVLVLFLLLPAAVIAVLYITVLVAWVAIEQPRRKRLIAQSELTFKHHPAVKIAIAGSYGKTSMKELLKTVLGNNKKVAATPGNKNVPISHARWAAKLDGDEDILLIEYGEAASGDIARFAQTTHPDIAIITGLAPNHLDHYGTLEAVAKDLFSLVDYLEKDQVFVNAEPQAIKPYLKASCQTYDQRQALGWQVSDTTISVEGTSFTLQKDKQIMHIKSGLLGRHQVGPLALVAGLSRQLGVPIAQIEAAMAETTPYEHRMQPKLLGGAWIIDDAYNGSLEGFRAGLALLKELPAKRKIYVTPGLVDQGEESERVHLEIGRLIANAQPDQVVLMQNSATNFIKEGMMAESYLGELIIRSDPLNFYHNLDQYIAAGDLVMLQNDWTDNYH